jgi:DNA-binding transcriptional MerR regulator
MAGAGINQNSSQQDVIAARRQQVARLRLRGLSMRDIAQALALPPLSLVDAKTGKPYSAATICNDLKEAEWRASAQADIAAWKAKQLAEIAEVKRAAWLEKDLTTVLSALKQEADITGTKAPARTDVTSGDQPVSIIIDF